MLTPLNKNTSLAGIAKAILGSHVHVNISVSLYIFLRLTSFRACHCNVSLMFSLEGGRGAMTNCHYKWLESVYFKELKLLDVPPSNPLTLPPMQP